jgi:hypothetical protein
MRRKEGGCLRPNKFDLDPLCPGHSKRYSPRKSDPHVLETCPSASLRHRRSIGIRPTELLINRTIFVEYDSLELYNWFIFSPSYCETTRQTTPDSSLSGRQSPQPLTGFPFTAASDAAHLQTVGLKGVWMMPPWISNRHPFPSSVPTLSSRRMIATPCAERRRMPSAE